MDINVEDTALEEFVSFNDLRAAGIVPNWQTLRCWQRDPRIAFPTGRLFGTNTRRWSKSEIHAWLAARPTERSAIGDAA